MKKWNSWYVYEDQAGCTEWDEIKYDTFETWALSGTGRNEKFECVDETAEDFCDNLMYLAEAEQRHIPYETREDCLEDCIRFVKRWNNEAEADYQGPYSN